MTTLNQYFGSTKEGHEDSGRDKTSLRTKSTINGLGELCWLLGMSAREGVYFLYDSGRDVIRKLEPLGIDAARALSRIGYSI